MFKKSLLIAAVALTASFVWMSSGLARQRHEGGQRMHKEQRKQEHRAMKAEKHQERREERMEHKQDKRRAKHLKHAEHENDSKSTQ